jgi:hypothetical protein
MAAEMEVEDDETKDVKVCLILLSLVLSAGLTKEQKLNIFALAGQSQEGNQGLYARWR